MTGIPGPDSSSRERLAALVRRYEKDILRICYVYLQDAEQAKDAVQDTFLKAYLHLQHLRDDSRAKSWLARIAVNVCRDYLRSPWVTHTDRRVQPEDIVLPADPPDRAHDGLADAVMNLPVKLREAVTLRYVYGFDIHEAARILGITPSAVSRRCGQARARLKDELEGSEEGNE